MFDNFEQDLILTFIMSHNECIVNRKAGIDTHLVNIMYITQYRVTNFLSELKNIVYIQTATFQTHQIHCMTSA